jgi:gp16 family phage-associated protein
MSHQRTALTATQAKKKIWDQGITITQWAEAHNFKRREVYDVLNGVAKGRFGRAHDIAVALGLKLPISVELHQYDNTASVGGNRQRKAAA